jgi:hypothetical protein
MKQQNSKHISLTIIVQCNIENSKNNNEDHISLKFNGNHEGGNGIGGVASASVTTLTAPNMHGLTKAAVSAASLLLTALRHSRGGASLVPAALR